MRKSLITLTAAALIAATMSMTAFAMTAEEVTAKNPTSYTAGTNSVYGPSLSQEQLGAVAQATADFKTNYITDNMDNDTKIKTAHDYLKNNVSYIDWNKGEGANAAYGALAKGQAACSGYARAFKALCDSMDVACYYIHADATAGNPSHQWNMVEYNDGFYFIDVEANDSSGFNAIYHSSTHPYTCDMSQLPAIGSKSGANTTGTQTTNNGWVQENGKWYYYENGSKAANKWINGTYYVGSDGAMLVNTTTPDGYQVDGNGVWTQTGTQSGNIGGNDGVHTKRASETDSVINLWADEDGLPMYNMEKTGGVECYIIDKSVKTFRIKSDGSNVDVSSHSVLVYGAKTTPESASYSENIPFTIIGDPIVYKLEYDKPYSMDFTNGRLNGETFSQYCAENDLIIVIDIIDDRAPIGSEKTGWQGHIKFATPSSLPTGQIG